MILYVIDKGAEMSVCSSKLNIKSAENNDSYPLGIIDSICVEKHVHIDSYDICKLAERNISISWIDDNKLICSSNTACNNVYRMKKQFFYSDNNDFNLHLSKKLIKAKIHNQYCLLQNNGLEIDKSEIFNECDNCCTIDTLRGIEGANAKLYFKLFSSIFPEEFRFKGRSKRPALDFVNSCLNFLYTLLYRKYSLLVNETGLCSHVGFMHKIRLGHMSLVSDFIETFRAELADEIVLNIMSDCRNTTQVSLSTTKIPYYFKKMLIEKFEAKCDLFCRSDNGYQNTYNGKMKEQLYSYISAIENDNPDLFKPFISKKV